MIRWRAKLTLCFVGALATILVGVLFAELAGGRSRSSQAPGAALTATDETAELPWTSRSSREERGSTYAGAPQGPQGPPSSVAPVASDRRAPERRPLSREEGVADEAARHDRWIDDYKRERVDDAWARTVVPLFTRNFERISAQFGFKVSSMDCRTSRCVSQLEWPSYQEARLHAHSLATQDYGVNCARTAYYPEPAEGVPAGGSYSMTVTFDCEDSRAAGGQ